MIRIANTGDVVAIARIYNHYVENTAVTFEVNPVSEEEMASRVAECQGSRLPWLVAEDPNGVVGYCYATKWKGRAAYQYSVEASVYVAPSSLGRGWGTRLYKQLLVELRRRDLHAVICGITLPNEASVALHEKLGMVKVAHFKEVGRKFDQWIDVGYWQCLLTD
ncbi:Phosphinothricin N-acetyltransferase [Microbulbifer aggregans]|uniref:Phosphinothricin N-acetyltransferase n=1 Tax=Microbulbifer aggregans TaxID=1769779 RepID=A0A1C9W622_9GAMM|nr:arsinothricin resistance N-acetyltransferase ArsN1 family B [Microbulbifer aggregans]AOS96599.1 Phosphinothricin N-acetyltransferase [Microbulbifer aggregans]